ncbi:Putative ribonuclease H protein At1g65750, partial [Linum perenne]
LPISITNRIDSIIRNFVWGSSCNSKELHLISWDVVCQPKEQGGLGLQKANELSMVYLMKLG